MSLQTLPRSAEVYGREQRREIGAAVAAIARLWHRMGPEFDASYAQIEGQVLAVLDTAQERVATGALAYIPAVLAETGQRVRPPQYEVAPDFMVGTAGDGMATEGLAYGAVTRSKQAVASGYEPAQALAIGGRWLTTATGTLLSDTGRTAEKVAGRSRGVTTWVRMLEPPSCGRCIVLAGKESRRGQAFLRHPRCDCRNIPVTESIAGDFLVDSREYLESLDEEGLRKALGSKANARAYLDGADQNQIVNAYRRSGDVRPAQVYGRQIKYTTEGTTRRGWANYQMRQMAGASERVERAGTAVRITRDGREARSITRRRQQAPRLMPESIYQIATDREDAIRLLRLYGWI